MKNCKLAPELLAALENLIEAASKVHRGEKWDAVISAKKVIRKAKRGLKQ